MALDDAPDLARVPEGEFLMGSPDREEDERPLHFVFVSEFSIGRFPVSCDEYVRFVRATGYPAPAVRGLPAIATGGRSDAKGAGRDTAEHFKALAASYAWKKNTPPDGRGSHPVVLVTHADAVAYCRWLTQMLERPVRLPTEAEWEKAARGGREGQLYPWGSTIDPSLCCYLATTDGRGHGGTEPAGRYTPNGYGLYDMAGNVWEWVADWYDADYYSESERADPPGPPSGTLRIVRGGSWVSDNVEMLRCAYRHNVPPDTYAYSIGFRIVCPGR